jgi:hypothetical protein
MLLSCEKEKEIQTTTLDLNKFTIDIPSKWIYQQIPGYDSFVGDIKINDNEMIYFDYGWHSNHLNIDTLTHSINYKTIDGKLAKIVSPKGLIKGTTGVYFDSLETTRIWKFQMSGINLSKNNQILLLKSIESLNFKD